MRQAIVHDGVVVNIIVGEGGGVMLPEDSDVGIGHIYSGGIFTAPEPPPEPPEVSMRREMPSFQEQLDALFAGGKATTDMKARIDAVKIKYKNKE